MVLGAFRYAKTAPRLKALKSRLIPRETMRELLLSTTMEDAVGLLRETPYRTVTPESSPRAVQEIALSVFFERVQRIAKMLPERATPIVLALAREEEARDVLAIMRALHEGKELPDVPTARIKGTLAARLREDPEALVSMQRLREVLSKTWFKPHAEAAYRLAQELRSGEAYTWYSPGASLRLAQEALQRLSRGERSGAERLLCPLVHYRVTAALANAKALGIPVRALDRILGGLSLCGLSWTRLRGVYEREPGPGELLASVREAGVQVRIDTKLAYHEALEKARRDAWRESYRRAQAVYAGYPFTPVLALAGALMAKAEMMDVTSILTGILLGLKPDTVEGMLVTL